MVAASSSRNFRFFGFSVMSLTVDRMLFASFNWITPALASSNSARPPLVASFGITTVAVLGSSSSVLYLLE
ncbi:hypothetical protein D3C87_1686560 [compost metagenome]